MPAYLLKMEVISAFFWAHLQLDFQAVGRATTQKLLGRLQGPVSQGLAKSHHVLPRRQAEGVPAETSEMADGLALTL